MMQKHMEVSSASNIKTVGILVLWSDSYFDKAVNGFLDLLFSVDKSALAIFVKNNHDLPDVNSKNAITLNGSNSYAEFSGWQEGIEEVFRLNLKPKQVIFANDTFCNHHPWNWFRRRIYADTFKKQNKSAYPSIAGWKSSSKEPFFFEGIEIDSWISTFLFSLNDEALRAIKWEICPTQDWADQYILGGVDENFFFSSKMDPRLVHHLKLWLFNTKEMFHWYRAEKLNEKNTEQMKRKSNAILGEKKLSSLCEVKDVKKYHFQDHLIYTLKNPGKIIKNTLFEYKSIGLYRKCTKNYF